MSTMIRKDNFSYDEETKVITFDDNVTRTIGSLIDGDTMYLQQGRICLDVCLCYFDTDEDYSEKHCMFFIEIFEHKDKEFGPEFCNASHNDNFPKYEDLEKIDTVYVYVEEDNSKFQECFDAYTRQMQLLMKKYSTLKGI